MYHDTIRVRFFLGPVLGSVIISAITMGLLRLGYDMGVLRPDEERNRYRFLAQEDSNYALYPETATRTEGTNSDQNRATL